MIFKAWAAWSFDYCLRTYLWSFLLCQNPRQFMLLAGLHLEPRLPHTGLFRIVLSFLVDSLTRKYLNSTAQILPLDVSKSIWNLSLRLSPYALDFRSSSRLSILLGPYKERAPSSTFLEQIDPSNVAFWGRTYQRFYWPSSLSIYQFDKTGVVESKHFEMLACRSLSRCPLRRSTEPRASFPFHFE